MDARQLPAIIAWAACLLPLVSLHIAWLASTWLGLIEACIPYWEGCTSISRAARQEPVIYWFRFTMQPYGWLLAAFWGCCFVWAGRIHEAARIRRWALLGCGLVGALFYTLYATYLGEDGDLPRLLRRYGINLYFSMTVLAQMLLISIATSAGVLTPWLRRAFVIVLALLLGLGLASLPLQFLVDNRDAWLNALEWVYALLMVACYPLTAMAFAHTGFGAPTGPEDRSATP
jgi:hypothetical protein